MRFLSRKSKIFTAALMGAALVAGGGAAMAYISLGLTGSGTDNSQRTLLATPLTVTFNASNILQTGSVPVVIKAANPNAVSVKLGGLDTGAAPEVTSSNGACPAGSFVLTDLATTLPTIPANTVAPVEVGHATLKFMDSATELQNDCMSSVVTVKFITGG